MAKTSQPKRRKLSLPKLIEKYYADLADFSRQNVLFEMGTATTKDLMANMISTQTVVSVACCDKPSIKFVAFKMRSN
jgi:hypothetical protein